MNSYAAWAGHIQYMLNSIHTCYFPIPREQINYLTFHGGSLHGSGSVKLRQPSAAQTYAPMRRKSNEIPFCTSASNQRSVSSCLSRFLGSAAAPWAFKRRVRGPWPWQEAAGVVRVAQWCVQSWRDIPRPLWEPMTLNSKGSGGRPLKCSADLSLQRDIDIDPETCSQFVCVIECVSVCVCVCVKKKKVCSSDFRLEELNVFICLPCRPDCGSAMGWTEHLNVCKTGISALSGC